MRQRVHQTFDRHSDYVNREQKRFCRGHRGQQGGLTYAVSEECARARLYIAGVPRTSCIKIFYNSFNSS